VYCTVAKVVTDIPRSRTLLLPLIALVGLLVVLLGLLLREEEESDPPRVELVTEGPEAVLEHRARFRAGVEAIARHDATEALEILESFDFEDRPVEKYRLYLLANAYSLAGDEMRSREILEELWQQRPAMNATADAGFHLLALHEQQNAWADARRIASSLASGTTGIVSEAARRRLLVAAFNAGDPGAMYRAALHLATEAPASSEADGTVTLIGALRGAEGRALTPAERLLRAESYFAAGRPADALQLVGTLDSERLSSSARNRLRLLEGQALSRLGRYRESEELVEPLFSGLYRYAVPALETSARNRRMMAEAAPTGRLNVSERTTFEANSRRHREIYVERIHDLLSLPISNSLRAILYERLIDDAEREDDAESMKKWIPLLVEIEPWSDRGLQLLWDQGWAGWQKQNYRTAIDRLDFIARTYRNPAIQRQAKYWLAKSLQKTAEPDAAREIFEELAGSPYEDLYTIFARDQLGARIVAAEIAPAAIAAPEDWAVIAEREMPLELRLAWELTLLGEYREARSEITRNRNEFNQRFADALLAETFFADQAWQITNRFLKRAFPSIATAEQSDVPLHFLKMYYVLPYEEEILRRSIERDLDPALVAALIHQESTFNPEAVSVAGAMGLMQLMPGTGREVGQKLYATFNEARLFNPEVNINLGTYYIRQLLRMMDGDVELAVAGYNGGPYRIRRWRASSTLPKDEFIEAMPLSETRGYVKRVTLLRSSYRTLYPSLRTPAS
jgi:soluble lytic murein transglycosylase-like protein